MSTGEEKQSALVVAQSTALTKAGANSLAARGRADLRTSEKAEESLKRGLELRDQGRYEEAFACFNRGIDSNPNHLEIQFALGFSYSDGQGVAQDYAQAAAWYRKAAEQGDAKAQNN